ncbi:MULTISPECIES: BlaI/MecI/CopY family transcriptional regulator [Marinifilum]|jgi:Predicted transcriptional regulator|uniref:BlaI/MecI/CopY family transcriptional regulator n=3 Tax=Marinifilum TaxID=866673 RepID=A0A2V4A3K0_9BACT|nr:MULTISPECIES: BlaI/MecI/CopY family transcriptional regulator [Marinifilum]MDQ2180477.1 BlaI/MecI/CopY family transcriptional regulator [Marinifilum sp. D714]NOU61427.1 BlaI/MecI/CopY family transcriptional regulator [Marinifilum caeruleilacunae]PXY02477.1 BlaI/MecI/CopY family transcriptional regulator [Marinifilum breve]
MKELTRAEEQVMQILWELESAFVKEVIERIPEPKPAYNTVSTIVRILEKKGFVGHVAFGKSHRYHPLITKKEYTRKFMKGFVRNYFSNSYRDMVSFFAKEEQVSLSELEEVKRMVEEQIKKQSS